MSGKGREELRGIVRRVDPKVKPRGGDVDFTADYTVTSTDDKGGNVLTDVEVILCFWGSFWSATPAPSPSSDQYKTAFGGILTGPFMGGLNQYRGVGQGSIIYSEINDSTDPADLYSLSDVVSMLKDRIKNHGMPAPTAGHHRFYAVILPKGIRNSNTGLAGQHQSFTYDGVTAYYAWVDNSGSLTGHNSVTKVLSHELVEACTNPDVDTSNNSILVQGTKSDGTAVTNDEIGDTCNEQFATADMNGVECSVQSYWSKADNACILPLGRLTFWVDKDTFGRDEVQDVIQTSGGKWEKAFWLVVDGFSKNSFSALNVTVPVPTGPFATIPGVSVAQNPQIDYVNGVAPDAQQRIRVGFDVTFTNAALAQFPISGATTYALNAFLATDGTKVDGADASALFELVAGADPYFTNVDPNQGNVFYLSQDLRVFTATPALNATPVPGGPTFAADSTAGAFDYIQKLLTWLNNTYSSPSGADPFASVLPGQGGAYQGDSSVSPLHIDFSDPFHPVVDANYNLAVARVRLRGPSGSAGQAQNVRVFFRLWSTQTADTDYQTGSTYPSNLDANSLPASPQVGVDHVTLPFFATGDLGTNTDYGSTGANSRDITVASGDHSVWAYFGCFLNLFDQSNLIDGKQVGAWLTGTHHCLVAQVAYDPAPIFAGATPEASDKLAQRNLQVTASDNPGPAAAHRVPQTFDIRPSASQGPVDELMIDWGRVPIGSTASIYWPQVQASEVVALASSLYRTHPLTASEAHTLRCDVAGGVTYVPIPQGAGENFAGLFSLDLPTTVATGQEYDVVVRRVSTRRPFRERALAQEDGATPAERAAASRLRSWRYVVGTFQVRIPVSTATTMLRPEEDTLAIMRWRLGQLLPTDRWFRVLTQYVNYLVGRVSALGGDPETIPASPWGAPVPKGGRCGDEVEYRGKITEVIFDCHGDLEGFVLEDCCTRHSFRTSEKGIGRLAVRACRDGLSVTVVASAGKSPRLRGLVLRA